jgi:DNA repair exonuclease SbcCD ATPase subunit
MQFLSITLQNYRAHRNLPVEFNRELTLIGGPNESGKSTLVEALHRVLFLRAKGNSKEHDAMRSHSPGAGHPSVTLRFLAQGCEWTLQKNFRGQNGTVSLSTPGERALNGDEADARLASLLGVDGPASGRQLSLQWAHLWLWQGTASTDPTESDKIPVNRLTPRLQNHNGAADLLTSPLDRRLLAHFEEVSARYFTSNGKTAANGPLGRVEEALAEARTRHNTATQRVQRYERALADHDDAIAGLAELDQAIAQLEQESARLKDQAVSLQGLREQERDEDAETERLAESHTRLREVHEKIAEKYSRHIQLAEKLAPLSARTVELEQRETAAHAEFSSAENERERASVSAGLARAKHDLLSAASAHHQIALTLARLEERATLRAQRKIELDTLRSDFFRLPAIDDKVLKQLAKLETEVTKAEAALGSLATGIDLLAADALVHLGEKALSIGDSQVITEDTEIHLADGRARLRIRPGGGTSLADARIATERARSALARALAEHELPDLESAQTACSERSLIAERIAQAERDLAATDFARLDTDLTDARDELAKTEGRIQRLRESAPTLDLPGDAIALHVALEHATTEKEAAASHETEAAGKAAAANRLAIKARKELDEHRQLVTSQADELRALAAQLALLRQTHGEDVPRAARLAEAAAAANNAATRLDQTRRAIDELQPDLLERSRTRIDRSRENAAKDRSAQEERRITALATLRSDGVDDPVRAAEESAAALVRAEASFTAVQRDAEAVRLVRDLYHKAQQALADRFTRPLVDRIGNYLSCIFGPSTRVSLSHTNEGFKDLALSRDQGPSVEFLALSMGAREQVAAAVRLAAAEFLAADYDGCLPVVFDDAFAYADPERVRSLQSMLDLAAARGLQIIVLSCNPADYASLGAQSTFLPRPSTDGHVNNPENSESLGSTRQSHEESLRSTFFVEPATYGDLTKRFIGVLTDACAAGEPLVSSSELRRILGCERETFTAIREALLADGQIVIDGRSQRLAE